MSQYQSVLCTGEERVLGNASYGFGVFLGLLGRQEAWIFLAIGFLLLFWVLFRFFVGFSTIYCRLLYVPGCKKLPFTAHSSVFLFAQSCFSFNSLVKSA